MTLSEIFEGLTAIGLFISVALVFSELRRNGMEARLNNWINYTPVSYTHLTLPTKA